jgi:hypothetical protein
MIRKFEIISLIDDRDQGQLIVTRQYNFKETILVKEGALLNNIPVYQYLDAHPILKDPEKSHFDIYIFKPTLKRFPKGYFQVGQIVELVIHEIA